jgi:hypothetical protein
VPRDPLVAVTLRVFLLDLGDLVWMVAHPPQDVEDCFVLAGEPFGGVRAAVVDDAEPDVLDALKAGQVFTNVFESWLDAVVLWWLGHRSR